MNAADSILHILLTVAAIAAGLAPLRDRASARVARPAWTRAAPERAST